MYTHPYTRRGFSLLESAIILTIIAVLSVSILSNRTVKKEQVQLTSIDEILDNIEEALAVYIQHNGYLPCPASRTESTDSADYGVSVSCDDATASAAPAGTENIGADTDEYQVRLGMIPTRTLGIPDHYALDPWGNRLSYAIIRELGIDSASYTAYAPTQASDYVQIIDKTGAVTFGNSTSEIVNYVILSHGSDGEGAYSKTGTQGLSCPTGVSDTENCNSTKQFVVDAINDVGSGTEYLNDFVRWKEADSEAFVATVSTSTAAHRASGSDNHSCAINTSNQLYCWGDNGDGQLGDGTTTGKLTPTLVVGGFSDWFFVESNYERTCAIRTNGLLYCWGKNNNGQLGDGTNTNRSTPTLVSGGFSDWNFVALGYNDVCGIRANGRLYCWGSGSYTPTEVAGGTITDWKNVGAYDGTQCAVRSNGEGYCWGDNSTGKIGDGTNTSRATPTLVSGGLSWSSIQPAYVSTCGITNTNKVYCWGRNDIGGNSAGLGTNAVTNSLVPIEVSTTTVTNSYKELTTICEFSCAIHTNGQIYCWGNNGSGRLGSNYNNPEWKPTAIISTVTNWDFVTNGHNHTCATTQDNKLYCWGDNGSGQLGNGTTTSTHLPQLVTLP